MRIALEVSQDGALTVHVERCSPTIPPARVAAALAAAVEDALQVRRAAPSSPRRSAVPSTRGRRSTPSPAQPAPVGPAPVEPSPVGPAPVEPSPVGPAPVEPAPVELAPVAVPAPRDGGGVGRADDREVRARALRLLDDGLTDAQVCAQLGISRGRLLRWDADLAHDLLADAGGAR